MNRVRPQKLEGQKGRIKGRAPLLDFALLLDG